jgi:hypothetical protein
MFVKMNEWEEMRREHGGKKPSIKGEDGCPMGHSKMDSEGGCPMGHSKKDKEADSKDQQSHPTPKASSLITRHDTNVLDSELQTNMMSCVASLFVLYYAVVGMAEHGRPVSLDSAGVPAEHKAKLQALSGGAVMEVVLAMCFGHVILLLQWKWEMMGKGMIGLQKEVSALIFEKVKTLSTSMLHRLSLPSLQQSSAQLLEHCTLPSLLVLSYFWCSFRQPMWRS